MKKQIILVLTVFLAILMVSAVQAASISKLDPEGKWLLEKKVFVHYKDYPGKPGGGGSSGGSPCYKLMGVKWTALPVNYLINPTNNEGLSTTAVETAISSSAQTWDNAYSNTLFNSYQPTTAHPSTSSDGLNVVGFGPYSQANAIAVTYVWYMRTSKQIVESDMILNEAFDWGIGDSAKMDLQNIATHEFGHTLGLSDLYTSGCSQVTMYGYSGEGDIGKRTLENPDIAGLQKIYGP